jgi:methionyl-tRNA formyltransferase
MNKKSILFFCKKDDKYSDSCIDFIKKSGFELYVVFSSKKGEKLPSKLQLLKVDYIICFRSYFILPESLINKPRYFSINFHPGPPNYPGTGCTNFALYNNEQEYGITVHIMNKKVDSGKIVDVSYFPILEEYNLETLTKKTHEHLLLSFKNFILNIKNNGNEYIENKILENQKVAWSKLKRTSKELDKYQIISKDIKKDDLNLIIRSFNYPGYPIELELHGHKFVLIDKKNK